MRATANAGMWGSVGGSSVCCNTVAYSSSASRQFATSRSRSADSRTGSALDNAASESFNSTLEFELLSRRHFLTREQARHAVAAWIDEYHTDRRHSTNGMLSPVDYERTCATQRRTQHSIDEHHGRTAA